LHVNMITVLHKQKHRPGPNHAPCVPTAASISKPAHS